MTKYYLYVIGTSPSDLLQITFNGFDEIITHVTFGQQLDLFPTTFASFRKAKEALEEIKDNAKYIDFSNATILQSIIEGNELDVNKLKIYRVGIIGEVTSDEDI